MNEQDNPFEGVTPSNVFGSAPENVDPEDIFGDPWPDEYIGGVLHPEPYGLYTCVAEI